MRTPDRLAVALTVVLLATSACASSGDLPSSTTPGAPTPTATAPSATATASDTASPTPSGGSAALPDDLRTRPAVAAAIADTARREKVRPDQVDIAAWSPVTWNDGSIGCPEKGKAYTQALVEGHLLLLQTETGLFQYNAGGDGPFAYCATPSPNYSVGG
jgi:hypothetical protein